MKRITTTLFFFLTLAIQAKSQTQTIRADKYMIVPRSGLGSAYRTKFITDQVFARHRFYIGSDTSNYQNEAFDVTVNARFGAKIKLGTTYGNAGEYIRSGGSLVNPAWAKIQWTDIEGVPSSSNSWVKIPLSGTQNMGIGNTSTNPFVFGSGTTRVGEYNQYGELYGFTSLSINSGYTSTKNYNSTGGGYAIAVGGKATFGYHGNMPDAGKVSPYYIDVAKRYSSDASQIRLATYNGSGQTNVPDWTIQSGANNVFSIQKAGSPWFTADTTNSIYINAGRFNFGRSTGLNNSKFTFGGSATFAGDIFFNQNTKSLQALIDERKILFVDFGGVNVSNPASYSEYTYIFDTVNGVIYQYQYNPPPQQPEHELLQVGTFATASQLATKQNNLEGTGLVRMTGTTLSYDNNSYLSTSTASSTYFPRTSGVLYGLTSIRKKTAYNASDTLFVMGGLGSGFGEVGQADRLEFKQVSFTGVPRWDISNFVAGTYQTNLTFSGQNIGIKKTNPSYNLDINGTFRAVGNSVFDGNVGIGINSPTNLFHLNSVVSPSISQAKITANGVGSLSFFNNNSDNVSVGFDVDYVGGWIARHSSSALLYKENGKLNFKGNAGLTTGIAYTPTTRMTLDLNTGNLGIGTSSPNSPLHILGTSSSLFQFQRNGASLWGLEASGGTVGLYNYTKSSFALTFNDDKTVTYTPLTTAEINALTKVKGKMAYNSDTDKMVYCTGTAGVWKYFDGTNM